MFNISNTCSFNELQFCTSYPVHKACRDGDVQTTKTVLEGNPHLVISEDVFKNWTPIHWAAFFGKLDCLRQVASFEPHMVNIQSSKSFQTPLHCASEAGHPHCLLWLLQAGGNPEVKDIMGETALHKASRMGNAECVSLLLTTSCNPCIQNSNGLTASHIADMYGYSAIAAFIRKNELENNDLPVQSSCDGSQPIRINRKRSHDIMCNGAFKKMRHADMSAKMPTVFQSTLNSLLNPMTTSVVEHEKLCRMENGYSNSIIESYFNDFHGC